LCLSWPNWGLWGRCLFQLAPQFCQSGFQLLNFLGAVLLLSLSSFRMCIYTRICQIWLEDCSIHTLGISSLFWN
jgi:hypothetical protein